MFKLLKEKWRGQEPAGRAFELSMLRRVLDGTFYDQLKYPFHEERDSGGDYIPFRERRPSVRSNICKTVVDDSVSLLFAEGNFPAICVKREKGSESEQQKKFEQEGVIRSLLKEMKINQIMIDAATRGSIGSVAIHFQVLSNRVFLRVMDSITLTPQWDRNKPDTLLSVEEKYVTKGRLLKSVGYLIPDNELDVDFYFQRKWNTTQEVWYKPYKKSETDKEPEIDDDKTVTHDLGFVPIVWIKNLPGGTDIDGTPTLSVEAIDCQIEIDYQLSQVGRGLKFMSDPTLILMSGVAQTDDVVVKANAIVLPKDANAKLLEINGNASDAVIQYCKHLRDVAIENIHGSRMTPEKAASVQSGKAMEMLSQQLIWLADRLRISYGEGAILEIISMIIAASKTKNLVFKDGSPVPKFTDGIEFTLRWPSWFNMTMQDLTSQAQAVVSLKNEGVISNATATRIIAPSYDIEDPEAETKAILQEVPKVQQ